MSVGAVLALQEVSLTQATALAPFFEEAGYSHITVHCGKEKNDFMGQCVAWPKSQFTLVEHDVARVAPSPVRIAKSAICCLHDLPPAIVRKSCNGKEYSPLLVFL